MHPGSRPGMNVKPVDAKPVTFYDPLDVSKLVDRNAKLGIDVTGLNVRISSRKNMRVQPNATRITIGKLVAELFERGKIVNVHHHTSLNTTPDLLE